MAANYYEVPKKTIESCISANKEVLEYYDVVTLKYEKLKDMFSETAIPPRGLTIIPIKGILKIGVLLRDSEVARQVKQRLLEISPELYRELIPENDIRFKKFEEEIGNYLEFSFGRENVKRQVAYRRYRLDFVLFDQYHIEVDEYGHRGYNEEKEIEREKYISENTDYITIRYNPQTEMPYMLMAKILKEMEGVE